MTDPLEDRLRSHFADRAARVTADPDPAAFVERSVGRPHPGVPMVAGLVAVAAVLVGGSFLTGVSVAGSSPTPVVGPGVAPLMALAYVTGTNPRPAARTFTTIVGVAAPR